MAHKHKKQINWWTSLAAIVVGGLIIALFTGLASYTISVSNALSIINTTQNEAAKERLEIIAAVLENKKTTDKQHQLLNDKIAEIGNKQAGLEQTGKHLFEHIRSLDRITYQRLNTK